MTFEHYKEGRTFRVLMDQTTDHPPTIEMDGTSSLTPQYDLNSSALQERLLKLEAELAELEDEDAEAKEERGRTPLM